MKICRAPNVYFKYSLSSLRGLKTHLGELYFGFILAELVRPAIVPANSRHSGLAIPDFKAGGLWIPHFVLFAFWPSFHTPETLLKCFRFISSRRGI